MSPITDERVQDALAQMKQGAHLPDDELRGAAHGLIEGSDLYVYRLTEALREAGLMVGHTLTDDGLKAVRAAAAGADDAGC